MHVELCCVLFKARIKFPTDYPYSPPAFRFLTKMWHPNIYEVRFLNMHFKIYSRLIVKQFFFLLLLFQNGDVCISILHPPVDDPQSGELPSERWNPTQNVRSATRTLFSLLMYLSFLIIYPSCFVLSLSLCDTHQQACLIHPLMTT